MRKFITLLTKVASGAHFDLGRHGKHSSAAVRDLYLKRKLNDSRWALASEHGLKVIEKDFAELVRIISPMLGDYVQPDTGRLGNGLFFLMGGSSKWARPSIAEFTRLLVVAAVRLGASGVVELFQGWLQGGPFRTQHCVLLEGVTVNEPIELRGIRISSLPKESNRLPPSLPMGDTSATSYLGRSVLAVDCTHTPALFRPEASDESNWSNHRTLKTTVGDGSWREFSFDRLFESMALASGHYVGWERMWSDYGDLIAFSGHIGGQTYRGTRGIRSSRTCSKTDLIQALEICDRRHGEIERPQGLDLAITRWVKSIRPGHVSDKLIELRIALDGLYARREQATKRDVALRGAWHVGDDPESRRQHYQVLQAVYGDASSVLHARDPKHTASDKSLLPGAQEVCRQGILKKLNEGDPDWDNLILGF